MVTMEPPVLRSKRATVDAAGEVLTSLKQIRVPAANGGSTFGAWCYVLRLDGETLRDALILVPNGGDAPDVLDPRLRAKFATERSYYNERERSKGYEVLGSRLNSQNVRRIVEVLQANRPEAIAYCEDQIALCEYTVSTTGVEKDRQVASKRKAQFQKRLATVLAPFDPDELVAELDEIARAQRMSRMDAHTRAAVQEMIGAQVDARFQMMMDHFTRPSDPNADTELTGVTRGRGKSQPEGFE